MKHSLLHCASLIVLAGCAAGAPGGPAPAPLRTLAMNSEASGRLSSADARLRDSSVYQAWRFDATAGQIVQIDVMSTDFDAFAILVSPTDSQLARDDDSGGGTNARIIFTIPATGTYQVYANSYRRGQYGRYTVKLHAIGMASGASAPGGVLPGTVGQIMRGQAMSGQLAANDPKLSDGSVYQAWTFIGQAGETIQVDVTSADFDAYAIIQDGNGVKLAADDDSGGGTNARIIYTLPYTGAYRLIANTYKQGQYGSFSIAVK
jgi:serine protease Do